MRTFYVDIYFLVNFTVDILALHFASILSRVPIKPLRLIFLTLFLSVFACIKALMLGNEWWIDLFSFALCSFVLIISLFGIGISRRIRMAVIFFILNFLIGGIVSFLYDKLKSVIKPEKFDAEINRTLLFFAIIILLVFGILKLFLSLYSNKLSEKMASVRLVLLKKSILVDCLVDTGNLIVDPIDSTPVLLIKKNKWREIVDEAIDDVENIRKSNLAKYLRVVPIRRDNGVEIAYGLRADEAYVIRGKKSDRIKITFVLDKNEGSFGGYSGLLPAGVLEGLE